MSVDEHDEIQKIESSWTLTKRQEEGFVSFTAGSGDYSWGTILWIALWSIFILALFSVLIIMAYESTMAELLYEELLEDLAIGLFIVGLLFYFYKLVLELYKEVLELIHFNTYLVLTRDHLEVYWSPLKILKQKILIKDIESIDIQWQRFFWGGKKVPIEGLKEKLGKDKYDVNGYSSFNVNLQNKKTKTLNFKLREIAVAEQLSAYILNPQQFSATNVKANLDGTFIEREEERLVIYSSKPLLSKEEIEETKNSFKGLIIPLIIFVILCIATRGHIGLLLIGALFVPAWAKKLYLLLKNARIKKIKATPSLLTESRIGLFSKPKNRAEFTKETIDSFFVKQQENSQKYSISIILKTGVSHDLFIEFKERKIAEELIEKIKIVLANENKIYIDSESNSSQMDLNVLEEGSEEALDNEKEDRGSSTDL
jgi:hypothetical protein